MVSSMYSTSTTKAAAVSTGSTAAASQSASATRSSFTQASTGAAGRNAIVNSGAAILIVGAVAALL